MEHSKVVYLRFFVILAATLIKPGTSLNTYQQLELNPNKQLTNDSVLITKLMSLHNNNVDMIDSQQKVETPSSLSNLRINQSLEVVTSDKSINDQSYKMENLTKGTYKYVNKSANSIDKKNAMLLRKSLDVSQTKAATDGTWTCPNITDQRTLECGCDIPLTLRCSGDVHGLALIAEGLRNSNSSVSLLDCTLKNVTVLNEAKIFENVSLHGLFISSGEIKRVHRLAFVGLKTPLQILGLPNNALTSVPSNSLSQLKLLDRLDLSNNRIKELLSTDFMSLQKLTFLELSENQISSISPKTFNPLKNLVTLKLNGNRLGDSAGSLLNIVECINLRELDLKSNLIKGPLTFGTLPVIRGLETLSLDKNSFTSVQNGTFKNFPMLITLSLRHNQIDVLQDDAFIGLNSLQKLDLSYNGIVAVSGGSLKHLNRLLLLDFTHNFLRALTSDIIAPLPQLKELRLDGNDISIIDRNAMTSTTTLKNLSLRDNPLACDCKLQPFAEYLMNTTQLSSKDLMAVCSTPPFLEGAPLYQVAIESFTCSDASSLELDNDHIMKQIDALFRVVNDNFTITNSTNNIKFVDYNITASSLNLNWMLHLNKSIDFHSLIIFEESIIRVKLDKTGVTYRSIVRNHDEYFLVTVPQNAYEITSNSYEFCLVFSESQHQFFVGCSSNFVLMSIRMSSTESIVHKSDISTFDAVVERSDESLLMDDDMDEESHHMYPSSSPIIKTVKKSNSVVDEDDSIEVYPSTDYYNTLWPNVSLSILIICMSLSIIYILYTKYRHYYKIHRVSNQECISPSYSDDSINTQDEDENENTTNKYVKLQATTTL